MLASNVSLVVRVLVAESPGRTVGYARLRLGRVGEGEFQVTGEIKETEYVSVQDQLLGYVTIKFKVRRCRFNHDWCSVGFVHVVVGILSLGTQSCNEGPTPDTSPPTFLNMPPNI